MESLQVCLAKNPIGNQLIIIDHSEFRRLVTIFLKNFTSKNTIKSYIRSLDYWNMYLKEFYPGLGVLGVGEAELIEYRDYLKNFAGRNGKGFSSSTANTSIAALSSFYNFFHIKDVIKINPAKNLKRFKVSKSLSTATLPPEKVWEYFDLSYNPKKGAEILERCLVRMFFFMGNRMEEVRSLDIKSLIRRGENWGIEFTIKGGENIFKFIPEVLKDELGMLLLFYKEKGWSIDPDTPLFRGSRGLGHGKRISERGVGKIIKKVAKKTGLKFEGYTSHSGRAFTIYWVEKHKGLYQAQKWANHSSPETTAKYRDLTHDKTETKICDVFSIADI